MNGSPASKADNAEGAASADARPLWLAIHRYMGLATLVFLGLAAITGAVLCFKDPLDAALNPDLFHRLAKAAPIDALAAVTALEAARPALKVRSFPLHPDAGQTLQLYVAPREPGRKLDYDEVFVDRSDGHVAGQRQVKPGWDRRHLVRGLHLFHYDLLASDPGRWLMGVCAGGWLVGNLIGLYLTWPRRRASVRAWTQAWWRTWLVRRGSRLPRFMLDLHRASGLWLLIGITALAFTSVAMNFYDEAFMPAVRAVSHPRPSAFDGPPSKTPSPHALTWAQVRTAGQAAASARGITWPVAGMIAIPDRGIVGITFTQDGHVSYRGLGPVSVYVDAATGRFVYEDNPYRDSAGYALSRSLYPVHSGQVAGAPGVAVTFLLGLATLEMCVSGGYVWWKRRKARKA